MQCLILQEYQLLPEAYNSSHIYTHLPVTLFDKCLTVWLFLSIESAKLMFLGKCVLNYI